jgi:hypothetical protein
MPMPVIRLGDRGANIRGRKAFARTGDPSLSFVKVRDA